MTDIGNFLRKNFFAFLIILLTLHIIFLSVNFYIIDKISKNNVITIASFIKSFTHTFENQINYKIRFSKKIFAEVEKLFASGNLTTSADIKNFILKKYNLSYNAALISSTGTIFDTTSPVEKNLNLFQFPEAKSTLINAMKTGKISIDFPVLDSTHKNFHIYILKFFPEKNCFFQISTQLHLLNELIKSLASFKKITSYKYFLNMIYIYKEEKYKFFSQLVYGKKEPFNKEIVNQLLKTNSNEHLKTDFLGADYYKLAKYDFQMGNPKYNVLYNIKIKSVYNRNMLILFFILNLFMLLSYYLLYKFFYDKIKFKLVNPIKYFCRHIQNSNPVLHGEIEISFKEFKELKQAYSMHLENIKLKDFVKELIRIQEEERSRIAREIHDSIVQDLLYVLIKIKKLNERDVADILSKKIEELRNLMSEHDFSMLKLYGLRIFLTDKIKTFQERYPHIIFVFKFNEKNFKEPNFNTSVNLSRIVQEIINNAAIHSGCTKIVINLNFSNDKISLTITDNGKGFDIDKAFNKKSHFGLINIRERIYILNGSLSVSSSTGETKFCAEIPLT